ncbi:M56 family metallopeptidase [Actinophytocola algeriensis]|uniref:Zn-dependent protease with chaperone function n=1 Tax=Actinophytocola algeriensis TaxID=1768010 RepID=A0A7W7Q900_9PSEU|nr:M56 family metallopeptidase [Actinophytocola algeriensis]MBB4908869.1 Zn-dependent protease with chaperone function [Actinophytocola algeriensis]MBE1474743.1 Zn-dependent protease with chaperone function [Actinophytocola algeriensis]
MTTALALLAGAFTAAWLVPPVLHRIDLRRRDPILLIVIWFVSMTGVLLAVAAAVLVLLLPDHGPTGLLLAALHQCWSAVQHGSPPRVEETAGVIGTALLAAFTCRLLVVSVRGLRRRARRWQANLSVLRMVARPTSDTADILWLAHERPLAFSMSGRPGVVVATEGLTRHLAPEAVAAVVAHERAHLSGRHHLLVAAADALHTVLPFVPLFRAAPRAIRELVELAADMAAVRICGPAAVHSALLKVTRHDLPGTALAMAQDAVELRLARIRHGTVPPGRLRQTVLCGLAGTTVTVLPFLTALGILLGIAVVTCPLAG